MNFLDRIGIKLYNFYKNTVRRVPTGSIVSLMFNDDNTPTYPSHSFEVFTKDGYTRNELIFACINRTANAAASIKMLAKNKKSGAEIADSAFRILMARPNPLMSEFSFWHFTIVMLLICGKCYWQKVRDSKGNVIALWPMRPDWIQAVPGKKEFISGYFYGRYESERVFLPFNDVVDFQYYDPRNLYNAISPTAVAARAGDSDNKATDFIALFWERGAVPQSILTSKLKLTASDIVDIRKAWQARYGGFENWVGAPAVLDMDATFQAIGMSFKDMDFEKLDARNETRICMIFDIPPIIVGAKVGLDRSTFSNYAEARTAWWEDSLVPRFKMLADEINIDLVPDFGENIIAEWDFSEVSALQEDRTAKFTRASAGIEAGYFTLNMALDEVGAERLPAEQGDIYLWKPDVLPVQLKTIAKMVEQASKKFIWAVANTAFQDGGITLNEYREAIDHDNLGEPGEIFLRWLAQAAFAKDAPPPKPVEQVSVNDVEDTSGSPDSVENLNNNDDEGTTEPENENKGLLKAKLNKADDSDPLDHDDAIEVEDFSQAEIDALFDEWRDLPKP